METKPHRTADSDQLRALDATVIVFALVAMALAAVAASLL